MPRCPSCAKFVGLETSAEMNGEVEVEENGDVKAEVRLVRMCADCGSEELKEATLSLESTFQTDEDCTHEDGHAWELEEDPGDPEPTENVQTTDRRGKPIKNPRYMKTLIGATLTVSGKCQHCAATTEISLADEIPASAFDELT